MGAALLWLLRDKSGSAWCVLLLVFPLSQWLEQLLVQGGHGCRLSAMEAWKNILFYVAFLAALFALGKMDTSTLPSFLSAYSGVWVLPVEYSVLDFSGDPSCTPLGSSVVTCSSRLWKNLHIFYVAVNSNPEALLSIRAEWRSVHSRRFLLQLL